MDETPTTGNIKEERKIDMSGRDIQINYSPKIKIACMTKCPLSWDFRNSDQSFREYLVNLFCVLMTSKQGRDTFV